MRAALAALLFGASAAAAQAPEADDRRPPLFRLADADSEVYLLGSVHVLPPDALPLPPHVEAAYAAASVVAFELDLDAATAEAHAMLAAAMDEATVGDLLTPDQKAVVDAAFAAVGMPAGALDAVEPWFAGMTYGVVALQRSGYPVEAGGVDAHLFARAQADAKERVAFETAALQTAAFDDLSPEAQVAFLLEAAALDADSTVAQFGALLEAWSSGDDARLAALMNEGLTQPEVYDALLVRRNRAWVPQIEALLGREGETALVVVGAGHLVGEASVVALLREAGYAVERL